MDTLKQILLGVVLAGAAGAALAQASGQTSSDQKANDPFVERRGEASQARKDYKQGKITKEQYRQERAKEKQKLKSTGERSTTEQNIDAPSPAQRNK